MFASLDPTDLLVAAFVRMEPPADYSCGGIRLGYGRGQVARGWALSP